MISHRNIVQVLSFYKEPLHHYLVYELVTGGELFDEIVARADVGISEQECSAWMKQMFLALKECHDKQIVHRDIKLENLMLESKGPGAQIKVREARLGVGRGGAELGPAHPHASEALLALALPTLHATRYTLHLAGFRVRLPPGCWWCRGAAVQRMARSGHGGLRGVLQSVVHVMHARALSVFLRCARAGSRLP